MLPAYAGMILKFAAVVHAPGRAPRVCGDDPKLTATVEQLRGCSPRMRG